jgi:hypothetical protein
MTETTIPAAVAANPFDPETFTHGGGLWDGKTVTVTGAVAKVEALTYGDGKPVLDDKGQQTIQTGLVLTGIADGGDDKERRETYSVGDRLVPTPDGEGFVAKDGGPPKFHANSNMGKFSAALKASGFDLGVLIVRQPDGSVRQQLSRLVGARLVFKGEPKVGKDGRPIKDKKGYDKNMFLPVKFVGYAAGAGTVAQPAGAGGNGAAGGDAIKTKAKEAVLKALAAGPLTRADLVRTLAQQLAGDADSNAVIGLVVRDEFHKGQPWHYDGTQASL